MRKILFFTLAVLTVFCTMACRKDRPLDRPGAMSLNAKAMLKQINWPQLGLTAALEYNPDSTVKTIKYTGSSTSETLQIDYGKYGMVKNEISNSLNVQLFSYDNAGRIIVITKCIKESNSLREVAKHELSYNSSGKITKMDYYLVNGQGKTFIYSSIYDYDSNGMPSKITTTDINQYKTVIKIDKYSDEFAFDPIYFFDRNMGELNQIYNYSILRLFSANHKLPAKITVTNETAVPSILIRQINIDFGLVGQKILHQISTVSSPQSPAIQQEVQYSY